MKEIILYIINSSSICSIIGAIIGAFITHFLYNQKLKKEQKSKVLLELTKKRIKYIEKIRKLLDNLDSTEIYDITYESNVKKSDLIDLTSDLLYITFFHNITEFNEFLSKFIKIKNECYSYVNDDIYLSLMMAERYLITVLQMILMNKNIKDNLPLLGGILYNEIINFKKILNKELVHILNNPPLKYYSRNGMIYNYKFKKSIKKLKSSFLYKIKDAKNMEEICLLLSTN